jgi:arylsulfatase A-like enzyme
LPELPGAVARADIPKADVTAFSVSGAIHPAFLRSCPQMKSPARIWFLSMMVLAHALSAVRSAAAATDKPDILFIVADDLRADVMSAYGGPVKTPNLDKLAERGSLFTRATCGFPICHVSRTEMFVGRSLVKEASTKGAIAIKNEWAVWPEIMRQAGWHTVYSGKWHVEGSPKTRGFEETSGLYSSGGGKGSPLTFPKSATGRAVTGYTGWTIKGADDKALPELGVGLTPETDAHIADGAIRALGALREKPLFLHVNFTAPHDPLHWPKGREDSHKPSEITLPANFRAQHPFDHGNIAGRDEVIVPAPRTEEDVRRERAVYDALVENLDAQVGRIVQALAKRGTLDRTLIIFTSDHGLAMGSHGLMGKQNQYEHTANVPLILAGPTVPTGKKIVAQCALRDLFPTTCEMNGLPIPESVEGRSLVPVLNGTKSEVHDVVFGYFTDTQRMMRTADGWKLIWYPKAGQTQLFNVTEDPQELRNLAADPAHAERLRSTTQQLKAWMRDHQDPLTGE